MASRLGRVGLIFDSGAFCGAFGVGVAKALRQRKIIPIAVGGSSVGALNAAKLVEDSINGVEVLEKVWLDDIEKAGPGSVFPRFKLLKRMALGRATTSLYDDSDLRRLVNKADFSKVLSSEVFFQIVVMDELTEEPVIISNRDAEICRNSGLLREYVVASASVPIVFPPVVIARRVYSDGLVFWPLLNSFAELGCDTIFVAMNDQIKPPHHSGEDEDLKIRGFQTIRRLQNWDNAHGVGKFLQTRTDFHLFDDGEKNDPPILKSLKKVKDWLITTLVDGNFDGIRHRLVMIFPHCNIPTLSQSKFANGDITLAIKKGFEETNRVLDKLEE